jgi:hypothetical protein
MIAQASKNSLAAPSGYSEMLSSAVGKPLALVHIGCSLELATGQLTNQSSSRTGMPADKTLLKPSDTPSGSYSFPIKIGDRNRLFDGMVGTSTSPQRAYRATYSTFSTSTRTSPPAASKARTPESRSSFWATEMRSSFKMRPRPF